MFRNKFIFLAMAVLMLVSVGNAQNRPIQSLDDERKILLQKKEAELKAHKEISYEERLAKRVEQRQKSRVNPVSQSSYKIVPPNTMAPKGMVNVTLSAGTAWGDGMGYQLLLDETATQFGITIPWEDALWNDCEPPATLYDVFSHKIPVNADPVCTTSNIVYNNSITIQIPAGTYDFCVVMPEPGYYGWFRILEGTSGRRDNYVFQDGYKYHFKVSFDYDLYWDSVELIVEPDSHPDSPAAVTGYTVTPGAAGALSAVLNWTNPTTTHFGETLTELTAIKIYQNNNLIHTVNNPIIGGSGTYSVTVPSSAVYDFTIIPVNSAGDGPPYKIVIFIGIDTPGAPSNVVLTNSGGNAVITWTAPIVGFHGGWFDASTLKYKVTRLPDNVVLDDNITATTYTDNTIEQLDFYRYKVISVSADGEGGETISNSLIIGDAIQVPYSMGFEDGESWQLWKFQNSNTSYGWSRTYNLLEWLPYSYEGDAYLTHQSGFYVGNSWAFTPKIKFEESKNYKVRFRARAASHWYPDNYSVYIASEQTSTSVIGEALLTIYGNIDEFYSEYEIQLIGYTAGDYTIAFHCYSGRWGELCIDDFNVLEMPPVDVSATNLFGSLKPMVGKPFTFKALLRNEGLNLVTNYTVKMIDADDNVLSINSTGADIQSGERLLIELPWTPTETGNFALHAVVELLGDANTNNDISSVFNIDVQPEDDIFYCKIGDGEILDWTSPFNFYYPYSRVQSIYFDHEIIAQKGAIVELDFFNSFVTNLPAGKRVRVWMANTNETQLKEWLPESEFTLVYNGLVPFPSGQNSIPIKLNRPYIYEGQNLAIMTDRNEFDWYDWDDRFYVTNSPDFDLRTRKWNSAVVPFGWEYEGSPVTEHPNVVLKMDMVGGSVSGVVTDVNMIPIEGALVEIDGHYLKRYTNEDGEYKFEFLPAGNYKIKAIKHSYYQTISEEITVELNQNTEVDIILNQIPSVKLSGKVTANDALDGLGNVSITITGYENYSLMSDIDGNYYINEIYDGFTYSLTAKKSGYHTYTSEIKCNGADVEKDFMMEEILFPTGNVTATIIDDEYVKVEWSAPGTGSITTYILDDGTDEWGFNIVPNEEGWMGNQFNVYETGLLTSVDIYAQYHSPDANRPVSLDIYDGDRKLVGSSKPFVLASDGWVNVELEYIPYSGIFYAMVHWPQSPGNTHYLAYDQNGPNAEANLDWYKEGNEWSICWMAAYDYPGIFMIRANALSQGKSVSYGSQVNQKPSSDKQIEFKGEHSNGTTNAPECIPTYPEMNCNRAFIDYELYRLKKGQTENDWTSILDNTSDIYYDDYDWDLLPWGEYQYAVKARYTDEAMSQPRLSNIVSKDMYCDYQIIVTTNTGFSTEGAEITMIIRDEVDNYTFNGTVGADGKVTIKVWRGYYNMTVKLEGFTTHHEIVDAREPNQKNVLLYEVPYPIFDVTAVYSKDDDNVVVSWDAPLIYHEKTYILDDGKYEEMASILASYNASLGNRFNVNEDGDITSIDVFAITTGEVARTVTPMIYNQNRELIASGDPVKLVSYEWNNMKFDNVSYSGTFYAMLEYSYLGDEEPCVGYDTNGPNSQSNLAYLLENGVWSSFSQAVDMNGVFMIRVNANSYGTLKSYGYNNTQDENISTDKPKTARIMDNISLKAFENEVIPEWVAPISTNTSRNLLGYNVYRLIPGQPENAWETIASKHTETTFTDNKVSALPSKIYQYAVKVCYTDNVLSIARISNKVEIEDVGINSNTLSDIVLYPNPFKNEINISNPAVIKSVQILNVAGQKVKSGAFDGKSISTEELASGIYFVMIESQTGEKVVMKMVKK